MKTRLALVTAVLLAATTVARAQPAPVDPHHPPAEIPAAAVPVAPAAAAPEQPTPPAVTTPAPMVQPGMEGMLQSCMSMMGMMQNMQAGLMNMMMQMMMVASPAPGMGAATMTPGAGMPGAPGVPSAMAPAAGMPGGNAMGMPGPGPAAVPAQPMSPATLGYMAATTAMQTPMMEAMQVDDPDIAFVLGMMAHHQAAIDMARTLMEFGDDERVRQWAEAIIAAQQQEIDEMRAWMAERGVGPRNRP